MPTIIDGSGSATFQTPLPLAQGGTGNTTGNVVSSQIVDALNAILQTPLPLSQGGNGNTTGNVVSSQVAGALNATGSAPLFACRAWVNFNGTGTVAIRASGNVSSITDNGVGNYTVNFATAMPDANYAFVGNIGYINAAGGATNRVCQTEDASRSTASIRVLTGVASVSTLEDQPGVFVSIFR